MTTKKARAREGRRVADESADLPAPAELDEMDSRVLEASLSRSASQIARGELRDAADVLKGLCAGRK